MLYLLKHKKNLIWYFCLCKAGKLQLNSHHKETSSILLYYTKLKTNKQKKTYIRILKYISSENKKWSIEKKL